MSNSAPLVSHGRGGAANIAADSNVYTDGGVTREGPIGDQGDGIYSSGRGGTGNIGSGTSTPVQQNPSAPPPAEPSSTTSTSTGPPLSAVSSGAATHQARYSGATGKSKTPGDRDFVPETNVRPAPDVYHVGRGGEGNQQTSFEATRSGKGKGNEGEPETVHVHEGAAERFKQKLFGKPGKP